MTAIHILIWVRVAGFQQRPRSVYDIAEAGFRTDKLTLTKIAGEAEGEFKTFIDAIVRHNAELILI